jgi:hypothetical protein
MNSNYIHPTREHLAEVHPDILLLTDLDEAIIGVSQRINEPVLAVYDWEKIIHILMQRDDMDLDEAVEYTEFNIIGAWVGENTPIVVIPLDW